MNCAFTVIVGEQTYGKGTVQSLVELNKMSRSTSNDFGQLKYTIAKFYRINGGSTQHLGVIPDIEFPSYIDAHDFGESSEITALPWDQIAPTNYQQYSNLNQVVPELNALSEKRRDNDIEFQFLKEDINSYNSSKDKKYISLNAEKRKQEKDAEEEKDFERENERREIKGLKLLDKGEVPDKTEETEDIYLNETAMIVTDMINLSGRITKVQ